MVCTDSTTPPLPKATCNIFSGVCVLYARCRLQSAWAWRSAARIPQLPSIAHLFICALPLSALPPLAAPQRSCCSQTDHFKSPLACTSRVHAHSNTHALQEWSVYSEGFTVVSRCLSLSLSHQVFTAQQLAASRAEREIASSCLIGSREKGEKVAAAASCSHRCGADTLIQTGAVLCRTIRLPAALY